MKDESGEATQTEANPTGVCRDTDVLRGVPTTARRRMAIAAAVSVPLVLLALAGLAFHLLSKYDWPSPVEVMFGEMMADLHDSSIEVNVPGPEEFDRLLTRDLESYFAERTGREVTVAYELLRDWPSQSGTAYPKYYAWVSVFDGSGLVEEGVVRAGVANKEYFYVTHYFSADDARQNPVGLREVFADDVCQKIEQRLK